MSWKGIKVKKEVYNNVIFESEEEEEEDLKEYDTNVLVAEHKAKNKVPKTEIDSLRSLRIQLIHEVPHQHKIEKNAGSHVPSPEETERFQKYIVLKRGSYSPEEDKIICKNWRNFCKKHNWNKHNVRPFLFLRHGRTVIMRNIENRKKFVQFLANGLPNRTLYSVLHRFRNLFETHSQSRYTKEEDEIILKHIRQNPSVNPKCMHSDLAKVLNRTRASIWRRYQILKKTID